MLFGAEWGMLSLISQHSYSEIQLQYLIFITVGTNTYMFQSYVSHFSNELVSKE